MPLHNTISKGSEGCAAEGLQKSNESSSSSQGVASCSDSKPRHTIESRSCPLDISSGSADQAILGFRCLKSLGEPNPNIAAVKTYLLTCMLQCDLCVALCVTAEQLSVLYCEEDSITGITP